MIEEKGTSIVHPALSQGRMMSNDLVASCVSAFLAGLLLLPFSTETAFATGAPPNPRATGPVVHVETGQLRGILEGTTAHFFGIPFAAPPVGALPWREPQPPIPRSGVRDATKPGSACVQNPDAIGTFIQPLAAAYGKTYDIRSVPSSEDCLFLNVWVPNWPVKSPLPVMLWVHGGSNRIGSGAESSYEGTAFAAHGVLVVTIGTPSRRC